MTILFTIIILLYAAGFCMRHYASCLRAEKEQFDIKIADELYTLVSFYGGAKITWISKDIMYELPGNEIKNNSLTPEQIYQLGETLNPIEKLLLLIEFLGLQTDTESQMNLTEWKFVVQDMMEGKMQ